VFHTIDEFIASWEFESGATQKVLDRLTDEALGRAVDQEGRTIARLAWHVATTIPEMMGRTGLQVTGIDEHAPLPHHAAPIAEAYKAAAASLVHEVRARWTDASLSESDEMYNERWPRTQTLDALILHQAHHRGQLTVLMRQAGLRVPGIYGPAREDWASMGMEAPSV
jgi:uncharacterized damage-inducible protein DinB